MEEIIQKLKLDAELYLRAFEQYLNKQTTLKEKTIRNHVSNASLFVIDYLVNREGEDVIQGITSLGMFFTYFYIRKCMWSTPSNIKTTAASIKRFYKYLYEVNVIQKDDYQLLCNIIKSDMESWQYECAVFNGDIEGDDEGLPFY